MYKLLIQKKNFFRCQQNVVLDQMDHPVQLFALADHERLFEDAFAASTPPTFGRSVVAYMSVRDGGCDLSCKVVRYSEGVFSKLLSVEGLSPR